jgi:hypothetical protein
MRTLTACVGLLCALTAWPEDKTQAITRMTAALKGGPHHLLACAVPFCELSGNPVIQPGETYTTDYPEDLTGADHINISLRASGAVSMAIWFTDVTPSGTRTGTSYVLTGTSVASVDTGDGSSHAAISAPIYAPWLTLTVYNGGTQPVTIEHFFIYTPANGVFSRSYRAQ